MWTFWRWPLKALP